jgi:hypothetical protein
MDKRHNPSSPRRGHPIMFGNPKLTDHFNEFPEGGGYPLRFVEWVLDSWECDDPDKVLHLCAGSMHSGTTVDIRMETGPHVLADCRNTPFKDESFEFIMVDPPYSVEYAENLYGTADFYPRPAQIVKEGMRLLKPGGLFGILHTQVPVIRKPAKMVNVYGVTFGMGYAIRAWTVLTKENCLF